ncbi:helix-turn-helix protein [compost metagenome]
MSTFSHPARPVRQLEASPPPRRRNTPNRPRRAGDPAGAVVDLHRPTHPRASRGHAGRNNTTMNAGPGHERRKGSDVRFKHEVMERTRRAKKITQAELARVTGMKQPAISAIEAGEWPPTLYNAYRIAVALELNLHNDLIEVVELDQDGDDELAAQ